MVVEGRGKRCCLAMWSLRLTDRLSLMVETSPGKAHHDQLDAHISTGYL